MRRIGKHLLLKLRSGPVMPNFDYEPVQYVGLSKEDLLSKRKQYLNPSHFLIYENPVMLVDAKMQYMFDETGKRYLDMLAGYCTVSVGHCHDKVTAAAKSQIDKIQHTTTVYANPNVVELAESLMSKMPDHLETVFFTNSGSESNDLAMLLARIATENYDIISLRSSYHGMSAGAMGLTSFSTWHFPTPQGFGVKRAVWPNTYRGLFRNLPEDEQVDYFLEDLEDLIKYETTGAVAGFIAEPVQGVGGSVRMPDNYLKRVYELIREKGVCICDEVQTAFGRLGSSYWGFEEMGVVPDIVTMAKGLGNGHPIGAVATTREIGEKLTQKTYFNTFGGNPVSSAVGKAVLDVIEEEGTQELARVRGDQLNKGMLKLMDKYELIGQVRSSGLHMGVELVEDRETKVPAPKETKKIAEMLKDNGVLVGTGGILDNVFRINPPMCVTSEDIDFFVDTFDFCMSKL